MGLKKDIRTAIRSRDRDLWLDPDDVNAITNDVYRVVMEKIKKVDDAVTELF